MTTVEALQIKDLQQQNLLRIEAVMEEALELAYDLAKKTDDAEKVERIIDQLEVAASVYEASMEIAEALDENVLEATLETFARRINKIEIPNTYIAGYTKELRKIIRKIGLLKVLTK